MNNLKLSLAIALFTGLHFNLFAQPQTTESKYLDSKTGTWSVTMTIWPTPESKGETVKGLTAERTRMSDFWLHEVMHPAAGAQVPDFKRFSDLVYNKNENRWDYISIDSRVAIGIMNFAYQSAVRDTIISFSPFFPSPGFGAKQEGKGQLIRARNLIFKAAPNKDVVQQYMKTKSGKEWLVVQYEYSK